MYFELLPQDRFVVSLYAVRVNKPQGKRTLVLHSAVSISFCAVTATYCIDKFNFSFITGNTKRHHSSDENTFFQLNFYFIHTFIVMKNYYFVLDLRKHPNKKLDVEVLR